MSALSYRQRLQGFGLTTLLERRMRGDLMETYKLLMAWKIMNRTCSVAVQFHSIIHAILQLLFFKLLLLFLLF